MSNSFTSIQLSYLGNFTIDSLIDYDNWASIDLTCLAEGPDGVTCLWDANVDGDRLPEVMAQAVKHYEENHL